MCGGKTACFSYEFSDGAAWFYPLQQRLIDLARQSHRRFVISGHGAANAKKVIALRLIALQRSRNLRAYDARIWENTRPSHAVRIVRFAISRYRQSLGYFAGCV